MVHPGFLGSPAGLCEHSEGRVELCRAVGSQGCDRGTCTSSGEALMDESMASPGGRRVHLGSGGGCAWVKSFRDLGRVEVGGSQWTHSRGLSADPPLGYGAGQPG